MANTHLWVIDQLECYSEHDGKKDVVFNIHWRRTASNGLGLSADVYGVQAIALEADKPFTLFANLTKNQVVDWLEAAMGADRVAEMDADLDAQIDAKANPPVIAPPLPWGD
jgi:hypothetical protein